MGVGQGHTLSSSFCLHSWTMQKVACLAAMSPVGLTQKLRAYYAVGMQLHKSREVVYPVR